MPTWYPSLFSALRALHVCIRIALAEIGMSSLNRDIAGAIKAGLFALDGVADLLVFLHSTLTNRDFTRHHRGLRDVDLLLADRNTNGLTLTDWRCVIYLVTRSRMTLNDDF